MPKIKKCLSTEEPMKAKNKQINKKQALCSALNEKKRKSNKDIQNENISDLRTSNKRIF